MLQQTLCLSLLLAVIGICSTDDIPVISGVFMPNNINVDYDGAKTACAMQYSRLATLDEITTAFKKGYEFCKWGWIVEHKLVMLRLTPFEPCAGYNMGILIRDCPLIYSVFCADGGGSINVTAIKNRVPSYENASLACMDIGSVATKKQIEDNIRNIPDNTVAWYNWGVGEVKNGRFAPSVCNDTSSQASAFCYNPSLADVIIISNDQMADVIIISNDQKPTHPFIPGDKVLIKQLAHRKRIGPIYSGPWKVEKVSRTAVLTDLGNTWIHASRLKKCPQLPPTPEPLTVTEDTLPSRQQQNLQDIQEGIGQISLEDTMILPGN